MSKDKLGLRVRVGLSDSSSDLEIDGHSSAAFAAAVKRKASYHYQGGKYLFYQLFVTCVFVKLTYIVDDKNHDCLQPSI